MITAEQACNNVNDYNSLQMQQFENDFGEDLTKIEKKIETESKNGKTSIIYKLEDKSTYVLNKFKNYFTNYGYDVVWRPDWETKEEYMQTGELHLSWKNINVKEVLS
jgi:hypothetical protein